MRKLLLATTALIALASAPAKADIVLDTTGQGGTGNNVIFSQNLGGGRILGRLNGQNDEVVRFRDLSGNGSFTGATNGNDIKINNTSDLDITVFDRNNATQLGVTRDIFSIKGDGTLLIRATALETDGTFKDFNYSFALGNGQNGFDFKAINGEFIWDVDLKVVGGSIQDFEHFRIDVAPLAGAVPEPATWAMLILGFAGISFMGMRKKLGGVRLA